MDLTVIWCVVLNTRELIHISVPWKGGGGNNYAENIKCHHTKFSCLGNLTPGFGASQNICVHSPGLMIYSYDEYTVNHTARQECNTFTYLKLLGPRVGMR